MSVKVSSYKQLLSNLLDKLVDNYIRLSEQNV